MSPDAWNFLSAALNAARANSARSGQTDWMVLISQALARAPGAQTPADTYPALRWALAQTGDPLGDFDTPADVKRAGQGRRLGLGIAISGQTVAYLWPGGPAERGGLHLGDRLQAVNGEPVPDQAGPAVRAAEALGPVWLTLRPLGGDHPESVTLKPAEFDTFVAPQARLLPGRLGYLSLPALVSDRVDAGAAYIATAHAVLRTVDEQGACGWVVDLRAASGGQFWPLLGAAGPLLGAGALGATVDKQGVSVPWWYRADGVYQGEQVMARIASPYQLQHAAPPVAVLLGPGTAGAGEGLALAFRGQPGARSFGAPTLGAVALSVSVPLSDGSRLWVAGALLADRSGQTYAGALGPDQLVPLDYSQFGTDQDPVLRAAQDWLKAQPGCGP